MSKIKGKPDVNAFLSGGNIETSTVAKPLIEQENTPKITKSPKPETIAKLVRLPPDLFEAIKDKAHAEYKRTRERVTENDLIVNALRAYFSDSK